MPMSLFEQYWAAQLIIIVVGSEFILLFGNTECRSVLYSICIAAILFEWNLKRDIDLQSIKKLSRMGELVAEVI